MTAKVFVDGPGFLLEDPEAGACVPSLALTRILSTPLSRCPGFEPTAGPKAGSTASGFERLTSAAEAVIVWGIMSCRNSSSSVLRTAVA